MGNAHGSRPFQSYEAPVIVNSSSPEAEERFRRAQEIADVNAFDWNVRTGEVRVSVDLPALRDLVPDRKFESWVEHVHPDDRAPLKQAIDNALQGKGRQEAEVRVVKPDGAIVWVRVCGQLAPESSPDAGHVLGVAADITSSKLAEQELRQAHDLLDARIRERTAELSRANQELQTQVRERVDAQEALEKQAAKLREQARLLDLANDAIFIRRLDGTVSYWNEGAERLYGWTVKEAMEQPLSSFLKT
ncbi:MAG TPA: PAS domain S-box protein, partial [Terriglobales bacterium]|nr:PAS domain S-box protein [Terriglobales bacterium]